MFGDVAMTVYALISEFHCGIVFGSNENFGVSQDSLSYLNLWLYVSVVVTQVMSWVAVKATMQFTIHWVDFLLLVPFRRPFGWLTFCPFKNVYVLLQLGVPYSGEILPLSLAVSYIAFVEFPTPDSSGSRFVVNTQLLVYLKNITIFSNWTVTLQQSRNYLLYYVWGYQEAKKEWKMLSVQCS